jgi:hypothetical protein
VAARLLGSRVRNPPEAWIFVLCGVRTDKSEMQDIQKKEQARIKYRVKKNTKDSRKVLGYLCFLSCSVKKKNRTEDIQDLETSTGKVQRQNKRIRKYLCCVL